MAKPYRYLRTKMSPEARAKAEEKTRKMAAAMPLYVFRKARGLTQAQLGEQLGKSQPEVSQLERQAEMYVGTLRRFLGAMGWELELAALGPSGEREIIKLEELTADDDTAGTVR